MDGRLLTMNTQVVVSLLLSAGVDGHTGVPARVTHLGTAQRQNPAPGQHLRDGNRSDSKQGLRI